MFSVKYLGMTLVGLPKGEEMAASAIHRITATVSCTFSLFTVDIHILNETSYTSHLPVAKLS